jgi:RNA polymerase sigma factor (sigma-70 family)
VLIDEDQLLAANDTFDIVINEKYNEILKNAIDHLPNQQKRVYRLIKGMGLKLDEVANQLQIRPETVKFHLAQAMKNIKVFCTHYLGALTGWVILLFFIQK